MYADEQGVIKIGDFGNSCPPGGMPLTLAGTPEYMAPEVSWGGPVTKKADIYSTGSVIAELWTDLPPFSDRSLDHLQLAELQTKSWVPAHLIDNCPGPVLAIVLVRFD